MEKNFKTVSKLLFPEETALNQTPSQKFENMLRKQLYSMRQERLSAEEQTPAKILHKMKITQLLKILSNNMY